MIPKDPIMLLSYVNTQLRDNYSSLADFAASNGLNEAELTEKLASIGYTYDAGKIVLLRNKAACCIIEML